MQDSNVPAKFLQPWGAQAGASYIRTVPNTSVDPTAASFALGFPPATGTPVAGGGTPPSIQDENGILNAVTAWLIWVQAKGPVFYDSAFSTAQGGYPKGAMLSNATTPGAFWISSVENNTSNPDTGGANWIGVNLVGLGTAAYKATSDNSKATVAAVSPAGITIGHIAIFSDTNGTIADGGPIFTGGSAAGKAASDNSKPTVSSVSGGTTINNFLSAADGNGTLKDSGYNASAFDVAGAAAAAQAAAQTFATNAANTAQSNAQSFATAADSAVLSSAQSYANTQATTAQNNAQAYALAQVNNEAAIRAAADALLAPLNSPAFTNNPTAPTQPAATNNTTLATTAFVKQLIPTLTRYARVTVSISGSFALGSFTWNSAFPASILAAVGSAENNTSFNPNANGNNFVVILYNLSINGGNIRIDTNQGGSVSGSVTVDVIGVGT